MLPLHHGTSVNIPGRKALQVQKRRNFTSPRFIRDETEGSRSATAHRRADGSRLSTQFQRATYLRMELDGWSLKVVDHGGRDAPKIAAFER